MKRIQLVVLLLILFARVHAQMDSVNTEKGISFVAGLGFAPGFLLTKPEFPHGYDKLITEDKFYGGFRYDFSFLWKEKAGIRLNIGRIGRLTEEFAYTDYAAETFNGYHYLPEYSTVNSGFSYSYFTTMFVYRIGTEPFNMTLSAGPGFGYLNTPDAIVELQHTGSNDYKEVKFVSDNPWNFNAEAGADFAYMRQLSPHWFMNTGVYVNSVAVFENYEVNYTEQDYGQSVSVEESIPVKKTMLHLNTGIFVNFQWNKRESERAFYY